MYAFLFVILFVSVLTLGPRMLNIDGDLPRHLLMGKIVLETGDVPTQEIFSYVYEKRPYTPHEWLAGVIYYLAYLVIGLNGVVLLAGILIAGTFTILYAEATRHGASHISMLLLVILGALVTSIHWVTRPHLFSMLFLAVWLALSENLRRGRMVKMWLFPLLMLVWANIHAEFIAGFLVFLAYLGGYVLEYFYDKSRTARGPAILFLRSTILSLLASLLNPAGWRTWEVVTGYLGNHYLLSRISETRPPDFARPEYWPLLALLALSLVLLIANWRTYAAAHFFLAVGFGAMSLLSARNAHLAGVILPFVLSAGLANTESLKIFEKVNASIRQLDIQARGSAFTIMLTILVGILMLLGPAGRVNRFEPSVFPVDAVRWLRDNPQSGRMFNAFDWGGYLLFHMWPGQKVFIESQTDVSGEVTNEYETVITLGEGWQDIIKKYDIAWAIIPPAWNLAKELSFQGWATVYQDRVAIILMKQ
jgi:hypothetical protein